MWQGGCFFNLVRLTAGDCVPGHRVIRRQPGNESSWFDAVLCGVPLRQERIDGMSPVPHHVSLSHRVTCEAGECSVNILEAVFDTRGVTFVTMRSAEYGSDVARVTLTREQVDTVRSAYDIFLSSYSPQQHGSSAVDTVCLGHTVDEDWGDSLFVMKMLEAVLSAEMVTFVSVQSYQAGSQTQRVSLTHAQMRHFLDLYCAFLAYQKEKEAAEVTA